MKTKIEWTDYTWNFITGCTQISPACDNCYAKAMTKRLQGIDNKKTNFEKLSKYYQGWDQVVFHKDCLKDILDKKKYPSGSKVFVNSMSDTFHEDINEWGGRMPMIFEYTKQRQDLIFQFLTKRSKTMFEFIKIAPDFMDKTLNDYYIKEMPKHCWFGVTAENQEMADERIPELLNLRQFFGEQGKDLILFVSIEPMLEFMNIKKYLNDWGLNWVIVGGENAPKSKTREMNTYWVHSILEQCKEYKIPLFFKQWGNYYNFKNKENYKLEPIEKEIESYKEFPKINKLK